MSHKKKENLVPCLLWVCKGVSQEVPDMVQLSHRESEDDLSETDSSEEHESCSDVEVDEESDEDTQQTDSDEDTQQIVKEEEDEDQVKKEENSHVEGSDEDINSRYDMDNYDESDEDAQCTTIENLRMFSDNKKDNYLVESDEEDKKEEEENYKIKPDDNLLVVGRYKDDPDLNEEGETVIEIYVYNKREDSFYVHHHMNLEVYPVALEWLDFHPSDDKKGSFVAVGDVSGLISVWDLDVVGQELPDYTLESENAEEGTSVNCLGWNKIQRNVLASGYSDGSIVLWDLLSGREKKVLTYHKGSVQTLEWDPFDAQFLLSGCIKGYIKIYDFQADEDKPVNSWRIKGEIEKVCWNKALASKFFCATDKGFVYSFNVNSGLEHKIKAHTDCVTALDVSPDFPNLLMTGSFDQFLKVWDLNQIKSESNEALKPIYKEKTTVDKIFIAKFAPDSELVAAVGGNSQDNNLKILDLEHLNPEKRKSEDTTENDVPEEGKMKKKKRKKKVKNQAFSEEGITPAPMKKKLKKNHNESSPTRTGSSHDTNSQTNPHKKKYKSLEGNSIDRKNTQFKKKKRKKTQNQIN